MIAKAAGDFQGFMFQKILDGFCNKPELDRIVPDRRWGWKKNSVKECEAVLKSVKLCGTNRAGTEAPANVAQALRGTSPDPRNVRDCPG